jgi:galactose mutarotase-like enzyme
MPVEPFGPSSRGLVQKILLGSPPGPVLEVLDLGATVHRLWLTGGDGVRRNVVLGHATAEEYLTSKDYVGATVGRYANRIRGARFELDGQTVQLVPNEGDNQLHGGPTAFDKQVWEVLDHGRDIATLRLVSPDGDQGFPGTVTVLARFVVMDDAVRITLEATTDAPTVVGLTSHAYLNLDGDGTGPVTDQLLRVAADEFVSTDDHGIPGQLTPVEGSPFDLRTPRTLGEVADVDHCFAVTGDGEDLQVAAVLDSPATRTRAILVTDQPGVQVYAGKGFDGSTRSTTGTAYGPGAGVALEPGPYPDTPNRPEFGSAVLRPGETHRTLIEWWFEAIL